MLPLTVALNNLVFNDGGDVTEEELRLALKQFGWGLHLRARRENGIRYAYARRNRKNKLVTIYLCPEHKIEELDMDIIRQKLPQDVITS